MEKDSMPNNHSIIAELGRQVNLLTEYMRKAAEAAPPSPDSLAHINHRLAGILASLRLLNVDEEKYKTIFLGISNQAERVDAANLEENIIIMKSLQSALQNFYIDMPGDDCSPQETRDFIQRILDQLEDI